MSQKDWKEMRLKVRDCQLICQLSWALFIITRFSFFYIITIQCGVVLGLDFGGKFLRLIREGRRPAGGNRSGSHSPICNHEANYPALFILLTWPKYPSSFFKFHHLPPGSVRLHRLSWSRILYVRNLVGKTIR
jgi:hypothetical protein